MDLKHIENVEGKYHLVFLEGRKTMECAKEDLRNAFFSLLLFGALLAGFVLIGGFYCDANSVFASKAKGKKEVCLRGFALQKHRNCQ